MPVSGSLSTQKTQTLLKVYFFLLIIECLYSIQRLTASASDADNSVLFGFSAARLGLILAALALLAGIVWLGLRAWRRPDWVTQKLEPSRGTWLRWLAPVGTLLIFMSLLSLAVPQFASSNPTFQRALERYYSLSQFLLLAGIQTLALLVILQLWPNKRIYLGRFRANRPLQITLLLLLLVWILVAFTGWGITPDTGSWWYSPGIPLMEWQWILSAALMAAGIWMGHWFKQPGRWMDWFIPTMIWGLAFSAWMLTPWTVNSYFTPTPSLPNYEIYPFSDAGVYDLPAQTLLIGAGFHHGQVIVRPLFVLFLAGLHLLAGQNYPLMILFQTAFLALFPLALYYLGKKLHSQAAGVGAALLCILRESNTISISHLITTSSTKMLMSDLPSALVMALLSLLVVRWIQRGQRPLDALAVGGAFGISLLLRFQILLIIPLALVFSLLAGRFQWKRWLVSTALVCMGVALGASPWIIRNWAYTGKPVFEQAYEVGHMAKMYSLDPTVRPVQGADESEAQFNTRVNHQIVNFIVQHPSQVALFVTRHFMHNEISSLAVLPFRYEGLAPGSPSAAVTDLDLQDWESKLNAAQIAALLAATVLTGLGISAAWNRLGWAGLAPLILHFGYSLSCALARTSGFRFILPTDWTLYFYAIIGLAVLFGARASAFPASSDHADGEHTHLPWKKLLLLAAAITLVGSLPPLTELVIPARYPQTTRAELVTQLVATVAKSSTGFDVERLRAFAMNGNTYLDKGLSLYPRYYRKGEGESSIVAIWSAYTPGADAHLGFLILGETMEPVRLPLYKSPAYFPNGQDVLVLGCRVGYTIEARLVVVGEKSALYTAGSDPFTPCPDMTQP